MFNQLATQANESPEAPLPHPGYLPYAEQPALSEPPYKPYGEEPAPNEHPYERYKDI